MFLPDSLYRAKNNDKWRSQHMRTDLKKLVIDTMLDNAMLKDVAAKNW